MRFVPLIRWCGGKRKQSEEIIAEMPHKIKTVWIPFMGGGSIMFQLLNSNIKYERVVCSDIYLPLIHLWKIIKDEPGKVYESYRVMYEETIERGEKYYEEMVRKFNREGNDPLIFHYLTRTCLRGNMEFDSNGNFCTRFQGINTSDGMMKPNALLPLLNRWNEVIQDVEFRCESYDAMKDEVQDGDYCFFDPPYIDGTWYKDNQLDMEIFYEFLRGLPCDYSITLNGDKDMYPIPEDLYTGHKYIYYGVKKSSNGRSSGSRDSFWYKHTDKYDYSSDKNNVRPNQRGSGGAIPQVTDIKMMGDIEQRLNKMENTVNTINGQLQQIISLLNSK